MQYVLEQETDVPFVTLSYNSLMVLAPLIVSGMVPSQGKLPWPAWQQAGWLTRRQP